ncbi:MAG TPA: penicillin-binding transpeptidase domain-containing protein [Polyangiaceae bacterium]
MGIILALVPVVRGSINLKDPLGKLQRRVSPELELPSLDGLDMQRLSLRPRRVTAPLPNGRVAELTLDPDVQRAALSQMKRYRIPEGGVVLMEVKTGRLLAYASYVNEGPKFDVNVRAEAPAASIFKVVTGAALVERGDLQASSEQCYHGGRSRIAASELVEDPERDKWCATLASAMGRSLNVVFGRLAQKHLTPEDLTASAGAFGFGAPVPFVLPNEAPRVDIPTEPLEFARAAAGFWHTSLSPLAAATLAQTVANGGVALEPRLIQAVYNGTEKIWDDRRPPTVLRRAVRPATARELTEMMLQTVSQGSAYKSFHDDKGRAFLGSVSVAGKTGTLTREKENRHYTWFVGFAPAEKPEVAVSALVVNTPSWHIKGPQLARDTLRAYFAKRGAKGVTAP